MRLIPIFTLLLMIQLGFWIFGGTACVDCSNMISPQSTSTNSSFYGSMGTGNFLMDFATDPIGWSSSSFFNMLLALITGSTAIAAGLYIYFRSDLFLTFPIFTAILGAGAVPIYNLCNLVWNDTSLWGCSVSSLNCFPPKILSVFIGVLAIWYLWAAIEFWTGRSAH